MTVHAVNLPNAADIEVMDIVPAGELQSCNDLLDDHEALMRFHDENGYILLRGVLNPESVAEARDAMMTVMVRHGLIEPDSAVPYWTGKPFPGGMEESEEFAGISRKLVEHPENVAVMEKILGEPASMIPIVQYRTYPPGTPPTGVHQDGFYSPGIKNYKPVWMPLVHIGREVGGLMIAVGQHRQGYFHNVGKPPRCPIPEGVIAPESWATTDYYPGDVLIIHPEAPHASMPNTSNRCRISIDTRVQSSADPRVFLGTVTAVSANAVEIDVDGVGKRMFKVDADTFIRVLHPGTRIPLERFEESARPGMRLVVVFEGDHAITLRKASEN